MDRTHELIQMRIIRRADLNGSNVEDLVTFAGLDPFEIALDVAAGKMYWTQKDDIAAAKIQRANLDGSNIEDVFANDVFHAEGITIQFTVCGDGMVEGAEECDGSGESASCDANCTFAACGDGMRNVVAGEECDAGLNNSDVLPDTCRTLIGLGRLAGLRTSSETHLLTWADVDFDRSRLSVYSPKTDRYEQHKRRTVPITTKLMKLLQLAFDAAEDGQEYVVGLSRNNLNRNIAAIIKRADVDPIDRPYQIL